jgi:hypothetical protein
VTLIAENDFLAYEIEEAAVNAVIA